MSSENSLAHQYLAAHAIDPGLALELGVVIAPEALVFPGGRRRSLNGSGPALRQPKGQPLAAWWPGGPPESASIALICEGESDALAAKSALARSPEAVGLHDLAVVAIPGTGYPVHRLVEELAAAGTQEALLALDGDQAGRVYAERAAAALRDAGIRPVPVELPASHDLADCLAATDVGERGEWIASALVDAELALPPAAKPAGDRPRLGVVTALELCARPDPAGPEELLGGLLVRRARTVLGGYTGEGKTTLALQLVRAVVEREELFGWTGGGGRALVIDCEQGLRSIKRRLGELGLDRCEAVDFLCAPDGLSLDQEDHAGELESLLAGGEYALVVADPLYKLHRGDSNEERHATDLMRRLDAWRERFGFALLLTTHPRKRPAGGVRFTIDELFGSGAYTWGAEVVLGLERPRFGYARLHFFKDRDGDLPAGEAWGLLFDREDGFRRDPEHGKARKTAVDRVRDLLRADPGMTLNQLRAATDCAERTVRDALRSLEAVSSGRPKRWELPSDDQEQLS